MLLTMVSTVKKVSILSMNKVIKKLYLFAFVLLVALGYFLRVSNYAKVPPPNSGDEYSNAWLGLSLLQIGIPTAGTGFEPYTKPILAYINVDDFYHAANAANPASIVSPWFDHPPLFGLVPGGYGYLKGVRNFADATTAILRKPMVWLGTFNIVLLIVFASLTLNKKIALVTAAIYATDPFIVLSSRMAQAENLLITLYLLALIAYYQLLKTNKNVYFWLAVSLSGVATLVKFSGWTIAICLVMLTLTSDNRGKIIQSALILGGTLLFFLLFPLYGYLYDWPLFAAVFFANTGRFAREGIGLFNFLMLRQNITKTFGSGWVALGWISAAMLPFLRKKDSFGLWIIVPMLSYLFVYLLLGSGEGYGWYKFPFLPFLTLAIGSVFVWTLENFNVVYDLLLVFLPGAMMLNRFVSIQNFTNNFLLYRLSVIALFLFIFGRIAFSERRFVKPLYKLFIISIFVFLIVLNVYTNTKITIDSWYNTNWLQSLSY